MYGKGWFGVLISTKGRYALKVLADMAEHAGGGELIKLRDAAERLGLSEKYLESIVHILVERGLLQGVRGKTGGYCFRRRPEEITVWEVLSGTEGTLAAVSCRKEDAEPCARSAQCRALLLWIGLDDTIRAYLSSYTVADIARMEEDIRGAEEPEP